MSGGHAQTVGGQLVRSFLDWPFPAEDVVVESENGVKLLARATWQADRKRPALVMIHGLEGSDRARYMVSTGILFHRLGWHVVRMNMRGCGDSLALCPRLYNAGLAEDVVAVLRWLATRVDAVAAAGFSLGGGMLLRTLGTRHRDIDGSLVAAASVCPPLDMSRAADELEKRSNWIYQMRFTVSLNRSYRKRQRLAPELYERDRERGIRTLREFDDVITAHYGGYESADDYYRTVSSGPHLASIRHPTLVLSSTNDPFIPADNIMEWSRSDRVHLDVARGAGHVGFVGRSRAPRFFWAADRLLAFFQEQPRLRTST